MPLLETLVAIVLALIAIAIGLYIVSMVIGTIAGLWAFNQTKNEIENNDLFDMGDLMADDDDDDMFR